MSSLTQVDATAKDVARGADARIPPAFGAALGLAIALPLLNFLREPPIPDFFGEWSSAIALALAALAVAPRAPLRTTLNRSAFTMPALIVVVTLVHAAQQRFAYAADWMIWVAYMAVASLAVLLGQVLGREGWRQEVTGRLAWALAVVALVNFLLQVLQTARFDVEWQPYLIHLPDGWTCRIFGNVGQTNHANAVAWMGIGGVIYLLAVRRIGASVAAVLLAILLLSSALTVSRMAWLFLGATVAVLFLRPVWRGVSLRSRTLLAAALVAGFVVANWSSDAIRANIDSRCVSGVARLVDAKEAGNVVRPLLWKQAIEVWRSSPVLGVGAGGFIGSVYAMDIGEGHQPLDSWVHNTALQLLAEFGGLPTGILAALVLFWGAMLVRRRADLAPEDGFLLIALAVIAVHSMLEFPLWYLHFLALAALFVGLLIRPTWVRSRTEMPVRNVLRLLAVGILVGSALLLVDYRNLDRLHFVSTVIQRAGIARDPETQQRLKTAASRVRFYGQNRDFSVALGMSIDADDLPRKIALVDRAMSRMPNASLVTLRILLATLDDDLPTARMHLRRAFKFHAQHSEAIEQRLRAAIEARPADFGALVPVLDEELLRRPKPRW